MNGWLDTSFKSLPKKKSSEKSWNISKKPLITLVAGCNDSTVTVNIVIHLQVAPIFGIHGTNGDEFTDPWIYLIIYGEISSAKIVYHCRIFFLKGSLMLIGETLKIHTMC